jgi:acyl-CoA synthetase (AMP-forming)/AMP-acid ligase II
LAYWAVGKIGAVVVPLSTLLRAGGLKTLLRNSDTVMVITNSGFVEELDAVRSELPAIDGDRYVLTDKRGVAGYRYCGDLTADAADTEPEGIEILDEDPFNIMYSSGTTGMPKGIVHTHYVRVMYGIVFASTFRMTPECVTMHAGAIVFNGAFVDDDGFLYLVDRKKDLIISGGVNVYPRDIEEVVVQHPDVCETAVFGAPHEKWGETPVAAVTLNPGSGIDAESLKNWVNDRVDARYQRLSEVVLLDEFPRNVAGKVLKREMRKMFKKE